MTEDEKVVIHGLVCPRPMSHEDTVVMGHGSGGRMTQDLIAKTFYPPLSNPTLLRGDDAALVERPAQGMMAVSTDAHIVSPLFFPGGDIGRLSVAGTVNDLVCMGAVPLWLTASFILEEGLPLFVLEAALESMKATAEEAGVQIIAGDTKVTERGKADGIFVSTTGIGRIPPERDVHGANAHVGDVVLVTGTIGDHGMAVLAARGELGFEAQIQSDVAPLQGMMEAVYAVPNAIHVLRDPTRGGLATTLNEIARQSELCIEIEEAQIPVDPAVEAACEMLGFDPLYIANEGKLVVIVAPDEADRVEKSLQAHPYGVGTKRIGIVREAPQGRVLMKTAIGGTRVVDVLSGELLPRIC
ncbi:MAG: hydrogenase expression/formation protein HypE [Anaerolineales bacterium]|jgi:hydrogenase expression/formation protein HypE